MDPLKSVRQAIGARRRRDDGPQSRRLTFAYDEQGVRLVRHADRAKPAPSSDSLDGVPHERTVVAEVRSANGEAIYRRSIPGALPTDVELFEPDGSMRREPLVMKQGVFTVVVPLTDVADHVVVDAGPQVAIPQFEVSADAKQRNDRVLLGRFPLEAPPEEED